MSEQTDPKPTPKPPRKKLPWQEKHLEIRFPLGLDCELDVERTGL